jgi:hypothetical protein
LAIPFVAQRLATGAKKEQEQTNCSANSSGGARSGMIGHGGQNAVSKYQGGSQTHDTMRGLRKQTVPNTVSTLRRR